MLRFCWIYFCLKAFFVSALIDLFKADVYKIERKDIKNFFKKSIISIWEISLLLKSFSIFLGIVWVVLEYVHMVNISDFFIGQICLYMIQSC